MTQIKLQKHNFEGPLDLLLTLIEEQKLDITQLALAEVTEQFLAHVRSLEAREPIVLADYLAVAAKLLVIKSKAILPDLTVEDEEPDASRNLEQQLALYKQFKDLAKSIKKIADSPVQSFIRSFVFTQRISFFPDASVTPDRLLSAIGNIVKSLKELDNLPIARVREAISIQEKISHLQNLLTEKIETKLSYILQTAKTKHEAIVTFLALLELIKQRILIVDQETSFAEITIRKLDSQTPSVVE